MNEVNDNMKWMKQNRERDEVEELKGENVSGMKMGKRENLQSTIRIPTLLITIVLIATTNSNSGPQ